jgi:serine/threonine protein kinase
MGEVYRARDSKLGRNVAIKVLPEGFTQDPNLLARFAREAQLLASLNHANIAAIYDLEESQGTRFLVTWQCPGTIPELIPNASFRLREWRAFLLLPKNPQLIPNRSAHFVKQ